MANKFKVGDFVYIKSTNAVGQILNVYDRQEYKTDTDGNRSESELVMYDPKKHKNKPGVFIPQSVQKKLRDKFGETKIKNEMKLKSLIEQIITEQSNPDKWASFNSHRAFDKAERILGKLSGGMASVRYNNHWYPVTNEQAEQIKSIKGVIFRNKLPGTSDQWFNQW